MVLCCLFIGVCGVILGELPTQKSPMLHIEAASSWKKASECDLTLLAYLDRSVGGIVEPTYRLAI